MQIKTHGTFVPCVFMVETAGLEPVTSTMRKAKMDFPIYSVKVQ